jgi:hypothetical protein
MKASKRIPRLPGLADDGGRAQPGRWRHLPLTAWPDDFEVTHPAGTAETDRYREFRLGKITARRHHLAPEGLSTDAKSDPRADGVAIGLGAYEFQAKPVRAGLAIVAQEQGRTVRLGDGHVEIAVTIDVRESGTPPNDGFEQVSAGVLRGHNGKGCPAAGAVVPEQLGRLGIPLALLDFRNLLIEMPVDTQQVEAAIQIIVEEKDPELQEQPACGADAFGNGFVSEQAGIFLRDYSAVISLAKFPMAMPRAPSSR